MPPHGTPGPESELERGNLHTHDFATDDEPIPRQDSPVEEPRLRNRLQNGLANDSPGGQAERVGTMKSLGGTTAAPTPIDGSTTLSHDGRQATQRSGRSNTARLNRLRGGKADERRDTGVPPGGKDRSWRVRMKSLLVPKKKIGQTPSIASSLRSIVFSSWLNLLLIFIPVSWALNFANVSDTVIFATTFLAIIPLAKLLAFATEEMALRVGETLGGLLNATLGNAVELIVAILALTKCQLRVVQASLIGSILSNLLLVLGMCFFAGGIKYSSQGFMLGAAQLNSSLLTLSVIGILIPATFHAALDSNPNSDEGVINGNDQGNRILKMSRGVSVILLFMYGCYLVYQLWTHAHLYDNKGKFAENAQPSMRYPKRAKSKFSLHHHHKDGNKEKSGSPAQSESDHHNGADHVGSPQQMDEQLRTDSFPLSPTSGNGRQNSQFLGAPQPQREATESLEVVHHAGDDDEEETPQISLPAALILLVAVTVLVAVTAEFLVDSINGVVESTPLSQEWVGLILLPIVGNAAEHVTAVTVSVKDKLDLSIGVAVGSSIQIALLVIPFIVVLAWIIGKPLTLLFDPFEAVVLFLTVITVNYVVQDGQSNWLEGMILMSLYVVIAVALWFYPGSDPASQLLQCR